MTPSTKRFDFLTSAVGLIGLIPIGLLAFWSVQQTGSEFETAIKTEWDKCPMIENCSAPQQCRINLSIMKQQYISELDGPGSFVFKRAGYPTISIGYPSGTPDEFLIPVCKP